jgi:hypothetical protein
MDDLTRTSRVYQRRRAATAETYAALVPLIRQARTSGMTLRAIANVTGLSFARIYQIEKDAPHD